VDVPVTVSWYGVVEKVSYTFLELSAVYGAYTKLGISKVSLLTTPN
jgi:hypothetical protein